MKMTKNLLLIVLVLAIALGACKTKKSSVESVATTEKSEATTEDLSKEAYVTSQEIGYRHNDLFDEDELILQNVTFPTAAPGTAGNIDRSFENAPPMIPHTTNGFVPIKASSNACLACHMPIVAAAMKATSIPKSHFTNYRPEVVENNGLYKVDAKEGEVTVKDLGTDLNKARYNCTQCHVTQAEISVFIPNDFNPDFRTEGDDKKSNLNENIGEGVK